MQTDHLDENVKEPGRFWPIIKEKGLYYVHNSPIVQKLSFFNNNIEISSYFVLN